MDDLSQYSYINIITTKPSTPIATTKLEKPTETSAFTSFITNATTMRPATSSHASFANSMATSTLYKKETVAETTFKPTTNMVTTNSQTKHTDTTVSPISSSVSSTKTTTFTTPTVVITTEKTTHISTSAYPTTASTTFPQTSASTKTSIMNTSPQTTQTHSSTIVSSIKTQPTEFTTVAASTIQVTSKPILFSSSLATTEPPTQQKTEANPITHAFTSVGTSSRINSSIEVTKTTQGVTDHVNLSSKPVTFTSIIPTTQPSSSVKSEPILSSTATSSATVRETATEYVHGSTSVISKSPTSSFTSEKIEYSTQTGFSSIIDLNTQLLGSGKCFIEPDTLYLGPDFMEVKGAASLDDCCEACSNHASCQSWVFNRINQTCILKTSFRNGYYAISGFTSGFSRPKCKILTFKIVMEYFFENRSINPEKRNKRKLIQENTS